MRACRPRLMHMATSSQGLRQMGTCSSELSSDSAFMALLSGRAGGVGSGRGGGGAVRAGALLQRGEG